MCSGSHSRKECPYKHRLTFPAFHPNRNLRQIFQSLPPFIDILLLLLFFMVIFAILGKKTPYLINVKLFLLWHCFCSTLCLSLQGSASSPATAPTPYVESCRISCYISCWCCNVSVAVTGPSLPAVLQHTGEQPRQSVRAVDHS